MNFHAIPDNVLDLQLKSLQDDLQIVSPNPYAKDQYKTYYHFSPDIQLSLDPTEATIRDCNRLAIVKLGYSRSELIGKSIFDLYRDDQRHEVKRNFRNLVNHGNVQNKQMILLTKEGHELPVLVDERMVEDEKGNKLFTVSNMRDISSLVKSLDRREKRMQTAHAAEVASYKNELERLALLVTENLQRPLLSVYKLLERVNVKYLDKTPN